MLVQGVVERQVRDALLEGGGVKDGALGQLRRPLTPCNAFRKYESTDDNQSEGGCPHGRPPYRRVGRIIASSASRSLGHASIAITLDTYSHVLPDMQDSAAT